MKEKATGFYFTLAAALLSIAGLVLYSGVMYRLTIVYVFCAAAAMLTLITVICAIKGIHRAVFGALPVINAALMASAGAWAVSLMVNQIGYVIAELDDKSTIMGLIYFEIAAVLAMLLNIIASFMKQEKNA